MDKEIVFRMTVAHIDSQQEYVNSDEIIKFYNSHLQKLFEGFVYLMVCMVERQTKVHQTSLRGM